MTSSLLDRPASNRVQPPQAPDPALPAERRLRPEQRRFDRGARLVGDGGITRLLSSHVVVFGIGGVGSFTVEALARAGIGRLTLIDHDEVCVTNINRQLHATEDSVGLPKAEVMAARVREIHPQVEVVALRAFYEPNTATSLLQQIGPADYFVDAIDNITAKCHLLDTLRRRGARIVSSMGAASKFDPTQVRAADLKNVYNDPFARAVRRILRRSYGWDFSEATGVPAVFSAERKHRTFALHYDAEQPTEEAEVWEGTLSFVTGALGLASAGVVVNHLLGRTVKLVGLP